MTLNFFYNRWVAALILLCAVINITYATNNSLLIKNWREVNSKPKVVDTRDNIFIEQVNNNAILDKTPANCLASKIADTKHRITWQPKWHYIGAGIVRLPSAKISPDRSVLSIIENTGNPGDPSGSRIILLNCYNFKILRIIELHEQLVTKLCYIPNTHKLIAAIDQQQLLKQTSGFMIIDLTGTKAPQKITTLEKISSMACSAKKLFIAFPSGNLEYYDLSTPTAPGTKIKFFKQVSALVFHPVTNRLLVATSAKLNYLKQSTMAPDIYAATDLPNNFRPNKIIITDPTGSCALIENNRRFMLVHNRQARAVEIIPGLAADMNINKHLLAVSLLHKQQIQLYQLPEDVAKPPFEPKKLSPRTRGDITMLAFIPEPIKKITKTSPPTKENKIQGGKSKTVKKRKRNKSKKKKKKIIPRHRLLIIDSYGNIYILEQVRRRWHKTLLFTPKQ